MPLDLAAYQRRPLEDLVRVLNSADPRDLPATGEIVPHFQHSTGRQQFPLSTARPLETRLPLEHPSVEVRGVELEQFLGVGGQGWVYAGRVKSTQKLVAVKILERGDSVLNWGAREAILCAKVRHPNILRMLRAEPAGAFWIVIMELVQGEELDTHPLSPDDARLCFGQLADALSELARARIVHRDIKPANILLRDPDRSPVLIDFGLAIDLAELASYDADVSGTPFFMPPEAYRDEPPAPAWDAYALGLTAAIALGAPIANIDDMGTLRQAKLSGTFQKQVIEQVATSADAELGRWISRLLAPQPAERLAAIDEGRLWSRLAA